MQAKPLLMCDIDGVISLWGFALDECPAGTWATVDGISHFLSARAGEHLLNLQEDFDLVWCSGWEEKANDYLPAALGLDGPYPYVSFGAVVTPGSCHWKLYAVEAFAGHRPLAWIDDSFNEACHDWAARRAAPTLLVPTEPAQGLTDDHVEQLRDFAATTRGANGA